MAIDRAQVRHVARLARLSLSPDEEEKLASQLSRVLEYIEHLSAVDVSSVEPLAFGGEVAAAAGALRPDEAHPGLSREEVLSNAPAADGASFLVPRILE